ncbi:MAG TPA: hypothetical protein DDX98_12485 [Bacteroidales bacterium]|jgi:hypothetical protein|nr:hypothetical protein [Bacteroidales bacterium]
MMVEYITKTIEELKQRVKSNVDLINKNQDAIKQMLKHSRSEEYAGQYDIYNTKNRELLAQNNDLINVQLTLVNFLDKYKNTAIIRQDIPLIDIYSITDIQEVFALTIKGIADFNEQHPYYYNAEFIDKLIVYYENKEDYERCEQLQKLKQGIAS